MSEVKDMGGQGRREENRMDVEKDKGKRGQETTGVDQDKTRRLKGQEWMKKDKGGQDRAGEDNRG